MIAAANKPDRANRSGRSQLGCWLAKPSSLVILAPVAHLARYDVYCAERGVRTVVYRDVLIRGFRKLHGVGKSYDVSLLLELEQANGQSVFVSRHDIVCLCKHGNQVAVEVVSMK